MAQITWEFDGHMARFVVNDPVEMRNEDPEEFSTFRQMYDYLDVPKPTRNYWEEIKRKLSIKWSGGYDSLKFELQKDRNEIAHRSLSDLDDLDHLAKFKKLSRYDRERMADMAYKLKLILLYRKLTRKLRK